jgi:hypothetical protein
MYNQVWREWSETYTRYVAASVENGRCSVWARGCQERIDVQVGLRWPASGGLARRRLGRGELTAGRGMC